MNDRFGKAAWSDFEKLDIRVGTVLEACDFPEARKPAYKLVIDFGDEIGTLNSSAQITEVYDCAALVGIQVLAVVNFPTKQIGPFVSQCLTLGVLNSVGSVVLVQPGSQVPNGSKLF